MWRCPSRFAPRRTLSWSGTGCCGCGAATRSAPTCRRSPRSPQLLKWRAVSASTRCWITTATGPSSGGGRPSERSPCRARGAPPPTAMAARCRTSHATRTRPAESSPRRTSCPSRRAARACCCANACPTPRCSRCSPACLGRCRCSPSTSATPTTRHAPKCPTRAHRAPMHHTHCAHGTIETCSAASRWWHGHGHGHTRHAPRARAPARLLATFQDGRLPARSPQTLRHG